MFDTLKDFLGSIYGCFLIGAFTLGSFYFGFSGQWFFLLGWCLLFTVPWMYILDKRARKNRELAMKGEIQIDSKRQAKAINDYFNIPSVKERVENENVVKKRKKR